jgi:hypothetical protein
MSEEEKQGIATFGFSIIGDLVSGRLDPGEQVRLIREKSRRKWQIPILIQNPCQQKYLGSDNTGKVMGESNPFIPMIERAIYDETAQNLIQLEKRNAPFSGEADQRISWYRPVAIQWRRKMKKRQSLRFFLLRLRLFKEVCGMKKRFSAEELRELRNLIPINTVIKELLSVPSKISEGYFRFLCPLCNEFQTSTNPSTNLARCYHCEKNFNPIDMVMAVKASQFIDSATYLQEALSRSRQIKKMLAGQKA